MYVFDVIVLREHIDYTVSINVDLKNVIICSTDFHKFMLVAESVTAILFPFVWQHVYVPILPAALSHFLDAPVPFLMGIYCASEEDKNNLCLPSEVHIVFLLFILLGVEFAF